MLKVIELFSGVGSQTQALKNINIEHEVVGISEINKYSVDSYMQLHGKTFNFGDIRKIVELPKVDMWTYSFPCFIEGTKVLTAQGYKNIEDVTSEDMVLTHKNRYMKVVKPMINKADHIYNIKTMVSEDIFVTEEHPFYVRKKSKKWDSETKKNKRIFGEPMWVPTKSLSKDFYVGTAINSESKLPDWNGSVFEWSDGRNSRTSNVLVEKFIMPDFWWIIGRYLGDGWIRSAGGIIICCDFKETEEITTKIETVGFNYSISKERTTNKIHISFKEIGHFCERFGRGAKNKIVTGDILNLPTHLLKGFLDGYMSADGCVTQGLNKATSISPALIYGIGQCVAKVYKRPFSIYKTKRPKTCVIEGRLVNQSDTYQITWKNNSNIQDKSFYEDGYIWSPINGLERLEYDGLVYNIEVENDNSYVVQNIIVHNCQDLSVSGKGAGIKKGTRSGLLFEVERLLENSEKPKYLLMENVKNLIGKKNKQDFDMWCEKLTNIGYRNYYQVLNSKDYGVPQNRERVFMVSILGEHDEYVFPEPTELKTKLIDVLEKSVSEKFYLNDEIVEKFKYNSNLEIEKPKLDCLGMLDIKGNECIRRVYNANGLSHTLTTMEGGNRQPKVLLDRLIGASRGRNPNNPSDRTIGTPTEQRLEVNLNGTSNTITTVQKDNYVVEGKVLIKNATKLGYLEAEYGDYINLQFPESKTRRGRVQKGISATLMHNDENGTLERDFRIRKLTPKECWRLMGWTDEQFDSIKNISNSQLYSQAGNGIVVSVLERIFENLFKEKK